MTFYYNPDATPEELLKSLKIVIICFFSVIVLSSCIDTMRKEDHAFINKIRTAFKEHGRIVKVSDIHSGDWEKVCASSTSWQYGDIRSRIVRFAGVKKNEIEFTKNSSTRTYFNDDVWLLYFYYPPNKIEVFKVGGNNIDINNDKIDKWGCAKKENAYFVKGNYYRVDWDTYSKTINPMTDIFVLTIAEIKEEKSKGKSK